MDGFGRNLRYIIGFGLLAVLLIFVIILIMRGGGNSGKVPDTTKQLMSYANDSNFSVTETIVGPIVNSDNHYETRISVSNTMTTLELIRGYDGNVIDSRQYPMSQESFGEFLNALQKNGYTSGDTKKEIQNDEGYCATGQRYIFQATDGNNTLQRFWATSCNGTKSYKGKVSQTLALFQAQAPDYGTVTQNTNLGGYSSLIL